MIPKSAVGNLTSDSSNIIGLIQDAYNDLKGQVGYLSQKLYKTFKQRLVFLSFLFSTFMQLFLSELFLIAF